MNIGIFVVYLIDYVYVEVPSLDKKLDVFAAACSIIGAVAMVFVIYYDVRATLIDPEDRIVQIQEECIRLDRIFEDEANYEYYCQICCMYVQEGSKHCRNCNKCTGKFDHHCYWLNNCIGGLNYNYFFKLLISALIAFVSIISMQIKCLVTITEQ